MHIVLFQVTLDLPFKKTKKSSFYCFSFLQDVFFFKKKKFIYLVVLSLNCGAQAQ